MIEVNKNRVDLIGSRDEVASEFMCLCVCLLDNYNRMYPGHEEALMKEMLNNAAEVFRKGGYHSDDRREKSSH